MIIGVLALIAALAVISKTVVSTNKDCTVNDFLCKNGGRVKGKKPNCSCDCPSGFSGKDCGTKSGGGGIKPSDCVCGDETAECGADRPCSSDFCEAQAMMTAQGGNPAECPDVAGCCLSGSTRADGSVCTQCIGGGSGNDCTPQDAVNFNQLTCKNGGRVTGKKPNCRCDCPSGFSGKDCGIEGGGGGGGDGGGGGGGGGQMKRCCVADGMIVGATCPQGGVCRNGGCSIEAHPGCKDVLEGFRRRMRICRRR